MPSLNLRPLPLSDLTYQATCYWKKNVKYYGEDCCKPHDGSDDSGDSSDDGDDKDNGSDSDDSDSDDGSDCKHCDDTPSEWMQKNGKDCSNYYQLHTVDRCNTDINWKNDRTCQVRSSFSFCWIAPCY